MMLRVCILEPGTRAESAWPGQPLISRTSLPEVTDISRKEEEEEEILQF